MFGQNPLSLPFKSLLMFHHPNVSAIFVFFSANKDLHSTSSHGESSGFGLLFISLIGV